MKKIALLVNKKNIAHYGIVESSIDVNALQHGQVLLQIDHFALWPHICW